MMRLVPICLIAALAVAAAITAPATARERRTVDATPFSRAPCSVVSGEPCTPSFCSVFNDGPCIPETPFPFSGDLRLTIVSDPPPGDAAQYRKPDHDLDTLGDLYAALRSCWTPPSGDDARAGMQMSVRFAFRKSGAMIAPPQVTYATPDAPEQTRDTYRAAINEALDRCAPLPLTKGLGGAIAGKAIMIRYVDNRELKQQPR